MFKKICFMIAIVCFGTWVCCGSYIYFNQGNLLFRGEVLEDSHAFSSPHHFSEIFLHTDDGAKIHALHYKAPSKNPSGVVLYFHGRGGNLGSYWNEVVDPFIERNYDVVMMDYRGFGKSKGKRSQETLLKDALSIYDYTETQYGSNKTVIYGRSLGTGIATYVAAKRQAKLLILEAPYFSILDLAYKKFPVLPKTIIDTCVEYTFTTNEWIPLVKAPIEIFHGTHDGLIPYDSSTRLKSLASQTSVTLSTVAEGKHDNLRHHEIYQERLDDLLNSLNN